MSKALLRQLFDSAIDAVNGRQAVVNACRQLTGFEPGQIVAVGKAAKDMLLGAFDVYGEVPALLVTKYQHADAQLVGTGHVTVIEAAHPIPDENSLRAGTEMLDTVSACKTPLLMLVSGGASALAECLVDSMTLEQWQRLNQQLIAGGQSIEQINHWRKQQSKIKAGRLLQHYQGPELISLAISDVQGDDLAVIGSGIGQINLTQVKADARLVATNAIAREAIDSTARQLGLTVHHNSESLYDEVFSLAERIYQEIITGEPGIYIYGGEPTIKLPVNPGNGGRNQSLALALAQKIQGREDIDILVAGTDGSDGPTDAAGAIVDGNTFIIGNNGQQALESANAGTYLRQVGDILITGPTGTNVMDLVIALKRQPRKTAMKNKAEITEG